MFVKCFKQIKLRLLFNIHSQVVQLRNGSVAGKEVKTEELVEQVKGLWTAQGHRVSSIKSLEVYVKPEDNAAYYVINGKENGKVDL